MSLYKHILFFTLIASCLMSSAVINADVLDRSKFDEELNERDFNALRDFLKSKRLEDISEEKSNLVLSGDVRTEWRNMDETCCGEHLRGKGVVVGGRPVSHNDFDIEFNLYFNCIYERSWAIAQIRYDNSAGVDDNGHPCFPQNQNKKKSNCEDGCKKTTLTCNGDPEGYHGSGKAEGLILKKAYFGYNLYLDGATRFDVELGRRGNLYNVFDSQIQFLSRFDGLLLKYDSSCELIADWYIHAGGFLIDERVNHFAWIVEAGLINIGDSNIDFKYSIIDWEKNGMNRCFVNHPAGFRFINSQFTLAYTLDPSLCSKSVKFYGAFLINHAAKKLVVNHHRTIQNIGWYAGILIGKVRKEGDFALEVQYQYVQAQSMPDDDAGGICRGNILDQSFTTCARAGNTNFKGWKFEGLYGFTDNITVDTIVEFSKAIDSKIGGRHTYSKLEVEAIYAF